MLRQSGVAHDFATYIQFFMICALGGNDGRPCSHMLVYVRRLFPCQDVKLEHAERQSSPFEAHGILHHSAPELVVSCRHVNLYKILYFNIFQL